jgi:hypothetical protein
MIGAWARFFGNGRCCWAAATGWNNHGLPINPQLHPNVSDELSRQVTACELRTMSKAAVAGFPASRNPHVDSSVFRLEEGIVRQK